MMFACAGLEVLEGLVVHFKPFEADDADEFITVFPNLALLQFHGRNYAARSEVGELVCGF